MKKPKHVVEKMVETQKKKGHPWRRPFSGGYFNPARIEKNKYICKV